MQEYTVEEVMKHNQESDLWIVMHGGVYDLTKFLKEHPGGEEVLINLGGQDGTTCFEDIGHTNEAVKLRETYKIGTLKGKFSNVTVSDLATAIGEPNEEEKDEWVYEAPKEQKSTWPAVILVGIYACIMYYLFFS